MYDISDRFLEKHRSLFKGTLYDLGAGESPYKDFFESHAEQYIAVDWAGSYHATKADIAADLNRSLPIESDVADTVVSLSVLEHLYDPQLMLKEAFRILKRDSSIVVQVPWQWWIHEAPYDYFRYTPYGLKHMFESAGFVDVQVEPQAGFFTMVTLKINNFSRRFVKGPRPIRSFLKSLFSIFWYLGQKLCPLLDKLDRNWELETTGYFVTARKR